MTEQTGHWLIYRSVSTLALKRTDEVVTLTLAILEAKPERRLHVRQALEEMIEDSPTEDPELRRYELYESPDDSNVFMIQQDVSTVDERLHQLVTERLMELGTALREELIAPIRVEHLRLVRALRPA